MAMTPDEIGRVIRLGEHSENEFKSVRHGLPRADDAAQTIVAFANAAGGRVVPPITCRHVKAEHLGELLIVTEVPPRPPGRPYRTQRGIHYVRGAASVRIASPDEIRRLVLSAGATALVADEIPIAGTTVDDLDPLHLGIYHREVYGEELPADRRELMRLLTNLRILTGDFLSLMGLLCFGRNPQRWYPWAKISAARSPGTDVGLEMLDRKDFPGTLDRQIEAAEEFLIRHIPSPARIRGFEPEGPRYALPLEAVREAVRNAVAHRDYAITGAIILTLYDDRLEVLSPGRLLNAVTVEAMKLGAAHVERNPLIATYLTKRRLMTERGTGVRRMVLAMREHGLPEPDIEERGPSLIVRLRMAPAQR